MGIRRLKFPVILTESVRRRGSRQQAAGSRQQAAGSGSIVCLTMISLYPPSVKLALQCLFSEALPIRFRAVS